MEMQTLSLNVREGKGSGDSGRMRHAGQVPGVIYGGDSEPCSVVIDEKVLDSVLHSKAGEHAVLQLKVTDKPELNTPVLLKSVQRHPIYSQVVHVDFMRIRLDQNIQTKVPLVLVGNSPGVLLGGVIDQQLREVEIECLALEVPAEFPFDISNLEMGDTVHLSDLELPEGITIITDLSRAVAAVHAPRVIEEEVEAEEGEEGVEGEEGEGEEGAEGGEGGEGGEDAAKE